MPLITTPTHQALAPVLLDAVKSQLVTYSAYVLSNDTYIAPNNPGYLAYNKRQSFANKVIQNPDAYIEQASVLISYLDSTLLSNTLQSYGNELFAFIEGNNPAGRHLFECSTVIGYNHLGLGTQGTIYDALAGVSQSDYV